MENISQDIPKAESLEKPIYIAMTADMIITMILGPLLGRVDVALMIGFLVPIAGVLLTIAVGGLALPGMLKGQGEIVNFTSFSPSVEQSFVVYERTAREALKRGATISIAIVGSLGLLFTIIVFALGGKGGAPH